MSEASGEGTVLESFSLAGKVALVTGGSRGIGASLARALAEAGADVALVARTEGALQEVAAEIESLGRRALAVPVDVSRVAELPGMVERVVAEFGRIDILVNAAGVQVRKPMMEVTEEDWDYLTSINQKAVYFCSQAVARQMMKQGKGKIVNIGSLNSTIALPNISLYATAKTAVVGMTRAMSGEWSRHGINVNAVGPGYFKTEMTRALWSDPDRDAWVLSRTPMGRWGELRELAGAVVFLASDASDFVTGALLNVDGGWLSA
jgi:2-deoxy-D-gluconate 3-dehydrogenase